jgi:hypothetical protein
MILELVQGLSELTLLQTRIPCIPEVRLPTVKNTKHIERRPGCILFLILDNRFGAPGYTKVEE